MLNYTKHRKTLALVSVSLFLFIVFGVLALCFIKSDVALWNFPLKFVFAICAGVCLLFYVVTLICVQIKIKDGKGHFVLSFEIIVVSTVVFVLSPISLIIRLISAIFNRQKEQ